MRELPPTEALVQTRRSLHRVAEHVLSAALKTATGQIALEPGRGGVRTPVLPDGRVVAIEGVDITVTTGDVVHRRPLTTVADAAALAGISPGFPWMKHPPATPLEPDAALVLDPLAVDVLADWFALGAAALSRLAAEIQQDQPGGAYVYPEHFDLGLVADAINYGASPGDDAIELPYVYVGPHEGPPARDDFWNAPFGAYLTIREVGTADDALEFFRTGREQVQRTRTASTGR